jgi:hypothetical protein
MSVNADIFLHDTPLSQTIHLAARLCALNLGFGSVIFGVEGRGVNWGVLRGPYSSLRDTALPDKTRGLSAQRTPL